jgi:hypothetical protein
MGLFGDAEKLLGQAEDPGLVEKAVEQGEHLAEEKTGHKYDGQVEHGGEMLEEQIKQHLTEQ